MDRSMIDSGPHKLAFYEHAGRGPCIALISGGPGLPSLYMRESHRALATRGRRIITWDQLGSGASDRPGGPGCYSLPGYVAEFEHVRAAANAERMHIIGHSWGGILALEYALTHPRRVASLAIVSIACDSASMNKAMSRARAALGPSLDQFMRDCEAAGSMENEDYVKAIEELNRRHMCRLTLWPAALTESFADFNRGVSDPIIGPVLFRLGGELADYDRIARLKELTMPVSFIVGEYDFVGAEAIRQSAAAVPGARFYLMRACSHMPMFEAPSEYMSLLREHLSAE